MVLHAMLVVCIQFIQFSKSGGRGQPHAAHLSI